VSLKTIRQALTSESQPPGTCRMSLVRQCRCCGNAGAKRLDMLTSRAAAIVSSNEQQCVTAVGHKSSHSAEHIQRSVPQHHDRNVVGRVSGMARTVNRKAGMINPIVVTKSSSLAAYETGYFSASFLRALSKPGRLEQRNKITAVKIS